MFEICPDAQQVVVSALNSQHQKQQKLILCHSLGEIQSNGLCSLSTHDLFRELIEDQREDFISVFPNFHLVANSMRKAQYQGFSFNIEEATSVSRMQGGYIVRGTCWHHKSFLAVAAAKILRHWALPFHCL